MMHKLLSECYFAVVAVLFIYFYVVFVAILLLICCDCETKLYDEKGSSEVATYPCISTSM